MNSEPTPQPTPIIRERLLRHAMARLLVALAVLFVTAPLLQKFENGKVIDALLLCVVLTAAVMAVGGRRKSLVTGMVLALPVAFGRMLIHFVLASTVYKMVFLVFLVFCGFVIFQLLRFILRARHVNSEVICATVSTYLLIGLLWAWGYALVARLSPGAITGFPTDPNSPHGFEAIYFSLITLTTVGYGDMVPVSATARMLAMLEAVCGTMYMAVLVARLVSLYSADEPKAIASDFDKS